MRKRIKLIIIVSVVLNIILICFQFSKTDDIDNSPPWHPFKLNSHLTLKSIVENGYRFGSSPCGFVQYQKQIADTIIQYEVTVDCKDYNGNYDPLKVSSKYNKNRKAIPNQKLKSREEMIAENKYYPWNPNEIESCYQSIKWRLFTINLGNEIDVVAIREYISKKGGTIISSTENWSGENGGNFMVYSNESNLYFFCSINKCYEFSKDKNWCLQINTSIPILDPKLKAKEKQYELKRNKYYNYE